GVLMDRDLDRRSRRGRGALRAGDEAPQHLLLVAAIERTNAEATDGVIGDYIRRASAARDDAVHARVRTQLLSHRVHGVEELDEPIERVHALIRLRRGVRRLAEVLDENAIRGERVPPGEASAGRGVDHHRGIDVVETAGAQERDLATAAL